MDFQGALDKDMIKKIAFDGISKKRAIASLAGTYL